MREAYRNALAGLEHSLLTSDAHVASADRRAAASAEKGAGTLSDYLERVRREAYAVTDEEVAELRRNGRTDDELFELTICAAYGAARRQLDTALVVLDEVYAPSEEG